MRTDMDNTEDFLRRCQAGENIHVSAYLMRRSDQERIEGALVAYQSGHHSLGNAIIQTLNSPDAAHCIERVLSHPQMFPSASKIATQIINTVGFSSLIALTLAQHNNTVGLRFLLENNHLGDLNGPQTKQKQNTYSAALGAARHGALQALNVLAPAPTPEHIDAFVRESLRENVCAVVKHFYTEIPDDNLSGALQAALKHKDQELVGLIVHSVEHKSNRIVLLSGIMEACLRAEWTTPVHKFAQHNPSDIKPIWKMMQKLQDKTASRFEEFLSYHQKDLLKRSIEETPTSSPPRKL